jgi:predicted nuclease with RNAse H fold
MAVYVDNMYASYRGMRLVHMLADEDAELHAMAARIGIDRKHWQSPESTAGSHYDICSSKRRLAVAFGAIEITFRQAGAMNSRRRITGSLGSPSEAVAWLRAHRASMRLVVIKTDVVASSALR